MNNDVPTSSEAKPHKHYRTWPFWALVVAMIITIAILSWLLWRCENRSPDTAGAGGTDTCSSCETSGDTPSEPATGSTSATYTATVGKFKLALENYVIIKQHDGGFEGGPITSVSIGTKSTSGTNVVDYPTLRRVDVQAQPLVGSFNDFVTNRIDSLGAPDTSELAGITIEGEAARVFQVDGLFTGKYIFFQHAGIVYTFIATDSSAPDTQTMLTAVIDGFEFVP